MLNQFSWQEFLTAALIVGTGYYTIATILLFHKEIIAFFKGKPAYRLQPSVVSEVNEVTTVTQENDDLIPYTPPEGYSGQELPDESERPEPIEVVAPDEQEFDSTADASMIIGVVSDLLAEIKSVFLVCAENKTVRQEVLRFIHLLLRRYNSLAQSEYKDSITLYIYHAWNEHIGSPVDLNEIGHCWTPEESD